MIKPARTVRVVQLINGLGIGGGERLLAETVSRLEGTGFEFKVYCLTREGPLADELRAIGVPVRRLTWNGVPKPWELLRFAADLRAADVLHSHFFYSDLLAALAGRTLAVPRRLATRHELGTWMGRVHRKVEPWVYGSFDRVLCVSHAVAESLLERGVEPQRLATVLPGVAEIAGLDPDADTGIDPPYIIGLGRLEPVKGTDLLVDAFARLAKDTALDATRLVIVGDGSQRAALERQARRLGVAERVSFLGEVERESTARLLRGAALFVLPSRSEAFGLSLLEAMQLGRPCVAARIGGVPEIVDDGATGLLFEAGDVSQLATAMRALLVDSDRAARLGEAARHHVDENFSIDRFVQRVGEMYDGSSIDRQVRR
ncbi:MAG: glycosyltransferase [Myxococcota bacterium]